MTKKDLFFFMNYIRLFTESVEHDLDLNKFFFSTKIFNFLKKKIGIQNENDMNDLYEVLNNKRLEILNQFNELVIDMHKTSKNENDLIYADVSINHPLLVSNLEDFQDPNFQNYESSKNYEKISKMTSCEDN